MIEPVALTAAGTKFAARLPVTLGSEQLHTIASPATHACRPDLVPAWGSAVEPLRGLLTTMSPRPKILMLIDRTPGEALGTEAAFGISFSTTPDPTDLYFFSLSHLLSTLQADVIKAHRQTDPAADHGASTPANIENFRFTTTSLATIDEAWLIGYNSVRSDEVNLSAAEKASYLDDTELEVLTTFMDNGGGVFATGDHAGLGASLAARVPRVRSMRKWWYPSTGPHGEPVAPPALSTGLDARIGTTQYGESGPPAPIGTVGVWFDAQSDDIPVYISPEQTTNLCYAPSRYEFNPDLLHPLLQGPNGPILGFADHMHEGEVVLPYEYDRVFTYNGTKFTEYPSGPSGVVHPQIIAWGFTNGAINVVPAGETGAHVGDSRPSTYRSYGVIGAYDGRVAGVGRVVVDSTFHHFMDINLIGDPVAPPGTRSSWASGPKAAGRSWPTSRRSSTTSCSGSVRPTCRGRCGYRPCPRLCATRSSARAPATTGPTASRSWARPQWTAFATRSGTAC